MTETVEQTTEEAPAPEQPAGLLGPLHPSQSEMPFGLVYGKAITKLPDDLYIPPDALEVFLEAFEGPLDLLLYLIKRQNLDILDIPVATITVQYMEYVELMKAMNFELAAEYLVMAAMLSEIKSRMLLPRPKEDEEEDGEDPRAELIRRLQEYERFKKAAEDIDELPRLERDVFPAEAKRPEYTREKAQPDVDMRELLLALKEVMHRADMFESHQISREKLSTRERMASVLDKLKGRDFVPFIELFNPEEGKLGVVVTFLATLELVKGSLIELVQTESFAPIHVKAKTLVLEESDLLAGLELDDEPDAAPDAYESDIDALDAADDDAHDGTKG